MEVCVAGNMEDGVRDCVGPVMFSSTAPAPGRPGVSRHCDGLCQDEAEDKPPIFGVVGVSVIIDICAVCMSFPRLKREIGIIQ